MLLPNCHLLIDHALQTGSHVTLRIHLMQLRQDFVGSLLLWINNHILITTTITREFKF